MNDLPQANKPVFTAHVEGDPSSKTVDEYVTEQHSSQSKGKLLVVGFVAVVLLLVLGTTLYPIISKNLNTTPNSDQKESKRTIESENVMNQTHDARRKSDLYLIHRATQLFYAERQRFPSSLDELSDARIMELGIEQASGKDMPVDPKTREYYEYIVIDEGQNCIIRATLSTGGPYELSCNQ